MTAGRVDATIKGAVVANTVFDAVLDATAILNWRNEVADKVNSNYDLLDVNNENAIGMKRQALINGNFDVWQRGTTIAAGNFVYTTDRWKAYRSGLVSGLTVSRQDGSGVYGSTYCLRAQRNSGDTLANTHNIGYSLETVDSQKLRGKKVTLSFYARSGANYSPAGSKLKANIYTGTGTDQSIGGTVIGFATQATTDLILTGSWQKFTLTTSVVIPDTVNQVFISFEATPTGTAGTNDYFEIAQAQVNAGDQALPFQPRSFAEELALCQRYYEKSYDYATALGTVTGNGLFTFQTRTAIAASVSGTINIGFMPFKARKRVQPTITLYATSSTTNAIRLKSGVSIRTGCAASNVGDTGFSSISVDATSANAISLDDAIDFHWVCDAEL